MRVVRNSKRTVAVAATALMGLGLVGCNHNNRDDNNSTAGKPLVHGSAQLASAQAAGESQSAQIEQVATFSGPMPTGVTVSHSGRIFVNFPRWGDPVEYSVVELRNGKAVAFPDETLDKFDAARPSDTLVGVQSVVVDPEDRLWILDTGAVNMGPVIPTAPKLIGVDLQTNRVIKTIHFPATVALPTTYLNDVRFDLRRGKAGMAFITDSSDKGPNGIIVVDLDSGESWRRLNDHPSTKADPHFTPTVEGQPLMQRMPGQPPKKLTMGSDGIAISADGKTLFYTPLISQHLYSVSVDALVDRNRGDGDVAATVRDLGDRGYASDGLESDAAGVLYLTDYEHNAVHKRNAHGGDDRVVVSDPRMIWPDTLSVATDGYLYFTCNQLNRQPQFHEGHDLRIQPYALFRTRINAQPVQLRPSAGTPAQ